MKKIIFTLMIVGCFLGHLNAQILTPVKWSYAAKRTGPNEAVIFIKASIEPGWHLYSQYMKDGGPVKTSFTFAADPGYKLLGKTVEPKPVLKFEKVFGMEVGFFETSVVFQQKIKLLKKATAIKGSVEFMVCNDKQCLPPDKIEFSVPVN